MHLLMYIGMSLSSASLTVWERSTTARATFALIPVVGRIIRFPQTRCSAVSYVRLLLDDTALK